MLTKHPTFLSELVDSGESQIALKLYVLTQWVCGEKGKGRAGGRE